MKCPLYGAGADLYTNNRKPNGKRNQPYYMAADAGACTFYRETTSFVKSHEMMKELYFFFFPERKDGNVHFVTDGTASYIVNDEERFEFELMMKEKNENTQASNDASGKNNVAPEKKKQPGKGLDLEW